MRRYWRIPQHNFICRRIPLLLIIIYIRRICDKSATFARQSVTHTANVFAAVNHLSHVGLSFPRVYCADFCSAVHAGQYPGRAAKGAFLEVAGAPPLAMGVIHEIDYQVLSESETTEQEKVSCQKF